MPPDGPVRCGPTWLSLGSSPVQRACSSSQTRRQASAGRPFYRTWRQDAGQAQTRGSGGSSPVLARPWRGRRRVWLPLPAQQRLPCVLASLRGPQHMLSFPRETPPLAWPASLFSSLGAAPLVLSCGSHYHTLPATWCPGPNCRLPPCAALKIGALVNSSPPLRDQARGLLLPVTLALASSTHPPISGYPSRMTQLAAPWSVFPLADPQRVDGQG